MSTLVARTVDLLAAHLREPQAQDDLINAALYGFPTANNAVQRGGNGVQFSSHCATTLLNHGPLHDGTHPLARVLEIQRDRLGGGKRDWDALIADVHAHAGTPNVPVRQRAQEWAYLQWLRTRSDSRYQLGAAQVAYVPLAGIAKTAPVPRIQRKPQMVLAKQVFVHEPVARQGMDQPARPEPFDDAVSKMLQLRQCALLGEPGAGKSMVLTALARQLLDDALASSAAPVPVLVDLANWTQPGQSLWAFVESALAGHGDWLPFALAQGRAALLLDSLNEVPSTQRAAKDDEVLHELNTRKAQHPKALAIVSCRKDDLPAGWGVDNLVIQPLDLLRVRAFAHANFDEPAHAEAFFWALTGEVSRVCEQECAQMWAPKHEDWQRVLWLSSSLQEPHKWYWFGRFRDWEAWCEHRDAPRGMQQLARNPYLLSMLLDAFVDGDGALPPNRGRLFETFVLRLLAREDVPSGDPRNAALRTALGALAYAMQTQPTEAFEGGQDVQTSLPFARAEALLDVDQRKLARRATLLEGEHSLRFTHQLLQEYFAARHLQDEIDSGHLRADTLWPPERWWARSGWEETVLLLAATHTRGPSAVCDWLIEAQPELAARCLLESGSAAPLPDDDYLRKLRARWLPRMIDVEHEPMPEARAAIGRAVGRFRLSTGELLDNRPGVGLRADGLPDIDWADIPSGRFLYGKEELDKIPNAAFRIARLPISYAQFQAFIGDPDGWRNLEWWRDLSAGDEHRASPGDQRFKFWNHPRECVSWYDAMAFCRWLSARQCLNISLPTEQQWERVARHADGREYPWGNGYREGFANVNETFRKAGAHYLEQTTAVGLYPHAATPEPERVLDLAGNVWEWCLNEYDDSKRAQAAGTASRVLRGGLWSGSRAYAHVAFRYKDDPDSRYVGFGFRVVCAPV